MFCCRLKTADYIRKGLVIMIIRNDYIKAVEPFIDKPVVKILTGVRRCGKSTIFRMVKEELIRRGVFGEDIIEKRYTEMDIPEDITAQQMYQELIEAIGEKEHCYLLLDEIQEVHNWEKAVNSILENGKADIYVTGSNSKLMSSEISTYLTGRFVEIPVFTLSFREYLEFKKESAMSQTELLEEYIRFGGFPIIALGEYEETSAYQIVNGIYHTVVSRDIVKRHQIKKQELFDRVVKYIIENTGKTFSEYAMERKRTRRNKKLSDKVTGSNNFSKDKKTHGNRKYRKEASEEYSMSDYLRGEIDRLIMSSSNFEEFEQLMRDDGYEIKYGNSERYGMYMAVRNSEMQRFRRTQTLGGDYTLSMIKKRIELFHSELPQYGEEIPTERWILVSKKLYYCSVSYDTKNPYLRRQYARLYRLGIFPNYGKRPLYSETKERIKQLRKTEYQIDLIMKNDCTTVEDLEDAINESLDSIKNLKDQEKEHRTEVRSYQKEWSQYEKLEELEGAFLLFQEGNESFKKEALEYQKLKDVVKQFPHTKDELRKFLDHETAYEKNLKGNLYEKRKQLEAMQELKEDYQRVMKEYAPADDEMLNQMREHGAETVPENIKGRKKGR